MKRREFITKGAILPVAGVLAGCSGLRSDDDTPEETPDPTPEETPDPTPEETPDPTPEETPDPTPEETPPPTPDPPPEEEYRITFEFVLDAVDDLKLDPHGNEPINQRLDQTLTMGDVLVEFPPGTYLWEDQITVEEVENWGLRGLGSQSQDVRFITDSDTSSVLLNIMDGEGVLIENATFDYSHDRNTSIGLVLLVQDKLRIQDVHFVGFNPAREDGGEINLAPHILDPQGSAVIDGFVRAGGTDIRPHRDHTSNPNAPGVIWTGNAHKGTLTIRNSRIENAGENGIYASRPPGAVQIEDSTFVNNNQSSVRISGKDSYVRNCEFVIDTDNAHPENTYPKGDYINPHAMMWEGKDKGRSGADIIDCEIVYRSRPDNGRFLRGVRAIGSIGGFDVRNTRFRLETDNTAAIWAQDPENPSFGATPVQPWDITLDGVSITGTGHANRGAVELHSRPDSVVTECCLHLTGSQDGIVITDSHGCRIEHTSITTNGEETVFSSADVETHDITNGNSCD